MTDAPPTSIISSRQEILLGLFSLAILFWLSQTNFLLFHALAEGFSIAIGVSLFAIFFATRRVTESSYFLFVGVTFLFVSFFDLLHTLAYKGMGVFPEHSANLATQLWIATRYLESISLLIAPLFARRASKLGATFFSFALVSLLLLLSIFTWNIFPDCYLSGQGLTAFKVSSEYIIIFILAAALWHLRANKAYFPPDILHMLSIALVLTMGSELFFTFYVSVFGISNVLGHFLKLGSFYFIFKALILSTLTRPYVTLFRELKNSEKLHKSIINTSAEGFWRLDDNLRISEVNSTMSKLLGYNAEQLKGRSYEDFLDREYIQKYRQSIEKPGYNPHSYLEVTLIGASGDKVQALANSTALSATQTRESLRFSFFTDITEIRKMERLHEDVQRIVRHDLKSPLNGIIGLASLLQEDIEQENQREFLQEIINSGNKMLHMINHSLELFKMEEGSYKLNPEQFNLNIVLANLERETSSLRKGKDLQVNYYLNGQELDWEKPYLITGEQRNLESMLANLLTNALEASPQGETVEVRISRNQEHVIEIHNQGTIPEEIRDKFFERYVTWGKNHGTGLGAYSARLIARAHRGDITFQSSEQKGTTLKVHLPDLA